MSGKLTYIKSLDGMRGLFCILIIMAHWGLAFPTSPIGWEGLQMFFTMSGFLITKILINEKEKNRGFGQYTKNFYLGRTFRIFPLYFGYLILMSTLRFAMKGNDFIQNQTAELEHSGVWLYTYLYNLKSFMNFKMGVPYGDSLFFSHLWSLSLEEQFYMLFPFLIYFLSKRSLKVVIIGMLIVPPIFRIVGFPYLMTVNPDPDWAILLIYRNLIFQMDAIALGAALAVFNFDWLKKPKLWFYILVVAMFTIHAINFPFFRANMPNDRGLGYDIFLSGGLINVLGYIRLLGHPEILQHKGQYIYMVSLVNIMGFLMILTSLRGKTLWKPIFENNTIVYLGKISYGLYVYHLATEMIFLKVLKVLHLKPVLLPYYLHVILFLIYFGAVVLAAHLSYNYFEMFFLKMKKKYR